MVLEKQPHIPLHPAAAGRQAGGKASFWPSTRDQSQLRQGKSDAKPPY